MAVAFSLLSTPNCQSRVLHLPCLSCRRTLLSMERLPKAYVHACPGQHAEHGPAQITLQILIAFSAFLTLYSSPLPMPFPGPMSLFYVPTVQGRLGGHTGHYWPLRPRTLLPSILLANTIGFPMSMPDPDKWMGLLREIPPQSSN